MRQLDYCFRARKVKTVSRQLRLFKKAETVTIARHRKKSNKENTGWIRINTKAMRFAIKYTTAEPLQLKMFDL